jgi:peptidyl-prolyl cis-trans isomerase B (cyclophilin B)
MKPHLMLLTAIVIALGLVGCSKEPPAKAQTTTPPRATTVPKVESVAKSAPAANLRDITEAPPLMKFTGTPYLTLNVKGFGTIKLKLDPTAAPQNVSNVYQLAKAGFYDGIVFHRIINNFMIQTGDPTGTGAGGPAYRVPAEIKLKNARGAVAMARQGDQVNPAKASSSCQFYIILKDQPGLDQAGYTVIGKVVEGMDVVDKIGAAPVQANPMSGEKSSPVTPVVMEKVAAEEK